MKVCGPLNKLSASFLGCGGVRRFRRTNINMKIDVIREKSIQFDKTHATKKQFDGR